MRGRPERIRRHERRWRDGPSTLLILSQQPVSLTSLPQVLHRVALYVAFAFDRSEADLPLDEPVQHTYATLLQSLSDKLDTFCQDMNKVGSARKCTDNAELHSLQDLPEDQHIIQVPQVSCHTVDVRRRADDAVDGQPSQSGQYSSGGNALFTPFVSEFEREIHVMRRNIPFARRRTSPCRCIASTLRSRCFNDGRCR